MSRETQEGAVDDVVDLGIDGVTDASEIGRGGFGVVYRATETELGRTVAVKLLSAEVDEQTRNRFDRERKAMGALSGHPHIVNVFHTGVSDQNAPYIVMEYLSGGTMTDRLTNSGAMAWEEVLKTGVQLCSALETAHRAGVLHRDVKPSNVLIDGHNMAKLGDFGIARLHGGPETKSAMITASIAHAPPEVISGQRPDARSDVYSLASTLYQLLTGTPAFARATDESLVPMFARIASEPIPNLRAHGVPSQFAEVMETAMAKTPTQRFGTALEFGRALNRCAKSLGLTPTALMVEGEPATSPGSGNQTRSIPSAPLAPLAPQAPPPVQNSGQFAAPGDHFQPFATPPPASQPAVAPGPAPHPAPQNRPVASQDNKAVLVGGGIAALLIAIVGLWAVSRSGGDEGADGSTTTVTAESFIGDPPDSATTTSTTVPTTTTEAPTTTTTVAPTTLPPRPDWAAGLPSLPGSDPGYELFNTVITNDGVVSFQVPNDWNARQNQPGQVLVSPDLTASNNGESTGGAFVSASLGFGVFDGQAFLNTVTETLDLDAECTIVSTTEYTTTEYSGLIQAASCQDEFNQYHAILFAGSNPARDVYILAGGEAIAERDLVAIERSLQTIAVLDRSALPDFSD